MLQVFMKGKTILTIISMTQELKNYKIDLKNYLTTG